MWTYLAVHIGRTWVPIMDRVGRPKWAQDGRPLMGPMDSHLSAMVAHTKWMWTGLDARYFGRPHKRYTPVHEARI